MKDVLAPAHLLAGDIEAAQSSDQRYGEYEGPRPDEGLEQQAAGDREADQRDEEVRKLKNAMAFR